jgi:hypothetical protein
VLRSYVAAIEDAPYSADGSGYGASYAAPSGFHPTVMGVSCWDGVAPAPVPATSAALNFGPCGGGDRGLQKIKVRVLADGAHPTTESATFVKRGPVTTTTSAP